MPHDLALVSVPDAVLAGVALLLAAYEAFLARAAYASRTGWREHAAVASLSLCAAAFALGMLVQYNGSPATALWVTRFEMVALVGIVHSMLAFAFVATGRVPRHAGHAIAASCIVWISLTPWVVADVELRPMMGLAHPFARRVETPLSVVAVIWCLGFALAASYWLIRHSPERRRDTRWFAAGIAAWSLAGAHDVLQATFAPVMWPNLLEYGFVGFLIAVVARDVQRHRIMLDRSRRDFRVLIERTPDAVAVVRDGCFVWMNRSCVALLGAHDDEADARRWEDVVERPLDAPLPTEASRPGETNGPYDVWLTRADGERRQVSVVALRMHYEDAPATVIVARDVTEERQLVARMIEMDRVITAGSLSAGVGHEINNPLAYSLLNIREARRTAARHDIVELSHLLDSSEEGMMRVDGVVRALRSFAQPDNPDAAADVERCVRSAVAIVGNEIRLRAQLDLDLDPTLASLGGETMLTQIVTSLLVNAAQAIAEGAPDENLVRVHTHDDDDRVILEVSDTGCGIPPENIHRVFDPFFSTKGPREGTGLGLSICRDKVAELGGMLEVDSVVGEGTTFRVTLPAAPSLALRPSMTSEAPISARSEPSQRRVLLVDDEVALLKALARPLRRHAHVVTAPSAEQALDLLEAEPFDLVISDLMMPGMSGVALYERVASRWPEVADSMIFMSGGAFTVETRQFCERMGDRVLSKPLDVDRVLAILRRHRPRLTSDVGNGA